MGMEQISLAALQHTLRLVHTDADLKPFQAHKRKWNALAAIPLILASLWALLLILRDFSVPDWWHLTNDIFSSLAGICFSFCITFVTSKYILGSSSLPEKVLELREQLHDEVRVPLVAEQPLPLEAEEQPPASARIGPVRRIKSTSITLLVGVSIFLLVIITLGVVIALLLPLPDFATLSIWDVLDESIFFTFFILLITSAVFLLVFAIRLPSASTVVVDEWGLRWKWPYLIKGISIEMTWPEITGFYVITRRQVNKDGFFKIYMLDSSSNTFFWTLWRSCSQQELQASTYLTRLIVTRTGLPLRDLTSAVEPLLNPPPEAREVRR